MAVDYAFIADLDDKGVTEALGRIDDKMMQLSDTMNNLFKPLVEAKSSFTAIEKAGKGAISAIRGETDLLKQDLKSLGSELGDVKVTSKDASELPKTRSTRREKNIFSQELQRLPQTTESRDFVQQSARQTTSPAELEELVKLSGQFTESQLASARATANTRLKIEEATGEFVKANDESEEFLDKIQRLQRSLEATASENSITNTKKALIEAGQEAVQLIDALDSFGEVDDDVQKVANEIVRLNDALDEAGSDKSKIKAIEKDAKAQLKILGDIQRAKQKSAEADLKLQARIEKANIRSRKVAERTLKAQIKAIPAVKNKLAELADEYDGLVVPIGNVNRELDKQQQEVLDLIRSDERLVKVIDELADETGEFNLALKRTDFKRPSQGMQNMNSSLAGFGKLLKGGIILAGLREIGRVALRVAEQVSRAFFNLTAESAKIADQFAGQVIAFENILPDSVNEGGGDRLFNTASDISRRLGVDASGIVSAVLPFVKNIDELDPFAETITELLSLSALGGDPKDQASAIRSAIDALVEGNARSIKQIFELTSGEGLDEVIAFAQSGDTFSALERLGEITAGRGVEFETFTETTSRQLGVLRENVRLLQGAYGDAINENFSKFLISINEFIAENSDEIETIVRRLGQFVTEIGNLAGSKLEDFIKNLDLDEVDESIKNFINTLKTGKEQFDVFFTFFKTIGAASLVPIKTLQLFGDTVSLVFGNLLHFAGVAIAGITEPIQTIRVLLGMAGDDFETFEDRALFSAENLSEVYRTFIKVVGLVNGVIQGMLASAITGFEGLKAIFNEDDFVGFAELDKQMQAAGMAAFTDEIRETQEALTSLDGTVVDIEINTDRASQDDADKFRLDYLTDAIEETGKEVTAAQRAVDEELADIQKEFNQAELELQKEHADQVIKLELDLHREIARMKRKHLDDLEKLADDGADDVEDLALKHDRKLEDIENKRSNDELNAAIDSAKKKLDIEEEYLRKLADLRRQFQFDANEAIRQNDAVAFLRLKRKFEFDQEGARIARDRANEDEDGEAADNVQKIRDNAEEARRAADLANRRSEEDLRTSQDRKLEDLQKAWAIQKREFRIREEERRTDLKKTQKEEVEALIEHGIQQRNAVKETMREQFDIISDGHDMILTMEAEKYRLEQNLAREHASAIIGIFKQTQDSISEGSLSGFLDSSTVNPSNNSAVGSPSSSGGGFGSITQLRDAALRIAADRGVVDQYLAQIESLAESNNTDSLTALINKLNKLPRMANGGRAKKGQPIIVGDGGVSEVFVPDENGTVVPSVNEFASRLNNQTQATQATFPSFNSGGNVDNSKNIQVDLSMLNPDVLTSGQISIIQSVVTQMILQATQAV